jgi:ATP-dependent Clp protease adaptor protein ClpS
MSEPLAYSPFEPQSHGAALIPLFFVVLNCSGITLESGNGYTQASRTRDGGAALAPEQSRTKPPPMYKVLLLNDDFTPMDFVVIVLEKFFGLSREQSTQVMLKVHREGKGACGVYPRDVAATKVEQVSEFSRRHQHPLACVMEEN